MLLLRRKECLDLSFRAQLGRKWEKEASWSPKFSFWHLYVDGSVAQMQWRPGPTLDKSLTL